MCLYLTQPPVDAPPADASPVEASPVDAPPIAAPKVNASIVPTVPSVAQDDQQCNQTIFAGSEGWETVRKRKTGNKQHSPPTKILSVSAKGKEVAGPADVNGNRRQHKAATGMLTRSSVHRNSNMSSGSGGEPPTLPHP
ncbi:hypothetical protein Peur_021520 [Populus x canadensis]